MTSLQHQAVSSVTSDSCKLVPPTLSSSSGVARVAGTRSTTPHRMNSRDATWVAAGVEVQTGMVRRVGRPGMVEMSESRTGPVPGAPRSPIASASCQLRRTCDEDGRPHQAHRAVHHLQHRRGLGQLERRLHHPPHVCQAAACLGRLVCQPQHVPPAIGGRVSKTRLGGAGRQAGAAAGLTMPHRGRCCT